MSPFADFLQHLFADGEAVLRERPVPVSGDADALALLRRAYAAHRLDVAGPPIDFDAAVALAAAEVLRQACWFLVSHDEPEALLDERLRMPAIPRPTAAQHLSADLALQYLPHVHRQAHALNPEDRLTVRLADLLLRWPLSGILSDVADAPLVPLDFDGHDGLLLLYAERLADHPKPAWMPQGRAREHVELVFGELGKPRLGLFGREEKTDGGA
ncbi:MAG TPA: hypothetical protein VKA46_38200 [Gemmataceae bacterium]|nr:hypothetical protein [Gemmataceae bacterium]